MTTVDEELQSGGGPPPTATISGAAARGYVDSMDQFLQPEAADDAAPAMGANGAAASRAAASNAKTAGDDGDGAAAAGAEAVEDTEVQAALKEYVERGYWTRPSTASGEQSAGSAAYIVRRAVHRRRAPGPRRTSRAAESAAGRSLLEIHDPHLYKGLAPANSMLAHIERRERGGSVGGGAELCSSSPLSCTDTGSWSPSGLRARLGIFTRPAHAASTLQALRSPLQAAASLTAAASVAPGVELSAAAAAPFTPLLHSTGEERASRSQGGIGGATRSAEKALMEPRPATSM